MATKTVQEWIRRGLHLPAWLRDFHDQKDVFKFLASRVNKETQGTHYDTPWTNAQIYVIDTFLHIMALCGWTLQRSQAKYDFADVEASVAEYREAQSRLFAEYMQDRKAKAETTKAADPVKDRRPGDSE